MPKQTDYDPEQDPAYRDAKRLILETERNGSSFLDLSGRKLTALPPEIGRLKALTGLLLQRNELTTLPSEIGKLTALTTLYAHDNRLTMLPPNIGSLTVLRKLVLRYNQLTTLPTEIGKLTALTELYLHDNPALGLPPEVLGPRWEEIENRQAAPAAPQAILHYYFSKRPRVC